MNLSGENAAAVLNNIYQRLSAGDVVVVDIWAVAIKPRRPSNATQPN